MLYSTVSIKYYIFSLDAVLTGIKLLFKNTQILYYFVCEYNIYIIVDIYNILYIL